MAAPVSKFFTSRKWIGPVLLAVIAGLVAAPFADAGGPWDEPEAWLPAITYGIVMAAMSWVRTRKAIVPIVIFLGIAASWFAAVNVAITIYDDVGDSMLVSGVVAGLVGIVIYGLALAAVIPGLRSPRAMLVVAATGTIAGAALATETFWALLPVWQGAVTFALVYVLDGRRSADT